MSKSYTPNILVESTFHSQVKQEAVKEAFLKYYSNVTTTGGAVTSSPAYPLISEDQTFTCLTNRLKNMIHFEQYHLLDIDFTVCIEEGFVQHNDQGFTFAYVGISPTDTRKLSYSKTAQVPLPSKIIPKLLDGKNLEELIQQLNPSTITDFSPDAIPDAFSILTKGNLTRKDLYVQGILAALAPLTNYGLYRH